MDSEESSPPQDDPVQENADTPDDEGTVGVDQVMRIHALPTPLKDVRRVKKDQFRDSPRQNKRQSMLLKAIGGNRTPVQEEKVIFHTLPATTNTGRVVQVPRNLQADCTKDHSDGVDRRRGLPRSNTSTGGLRRHLTSGIGMGGGGLPRSNTSTGGLRRLTSISVGMGMGGGALLRSFSSRDPNVSKSSSGSNSPRSSRSGSNHGNEEDRVLRDNTRNSPAVTIPSELPFPMECPALPTGDSHNSEVVSSPVEGSSATASPVSKERLNSARNKFRSSVRAMMFARNLKADEEPKSKISTAPTPVAGASIVVEPLTPDKLDGRGNNFFFSVVLSEKIRACGLLGEDNTRLRVPVLTLAEYSGPVSKSRWFVDAFTLPHNAVRRECMDMYELVIGIAKLSAPDDIMSDDIISFYEWWEVATAFIHRYFDVERKVLIPWVDAIGNADSHVRMALRKMRGMKESLKDLLTQVDKEWTKRDAQPAEATFSAVYKAIDAFVPRFMNYLADQEVLLPMLVKDKYTIDDRVKMEKELVSSFMRDDDNSSSNTQENTNHNIVLLVRWMANPRQLRAWVSKYLTSSQRQAFPAWLRIFQMEHERFVTNIKHRTGSSSKTE